MRRGADRVWPIRVCCHQDNIVADQRRWRRTDEPLT